MPTSPNEKKFSFVALLLLSVCILTFSNSLGNPFMMDDHALITRNKAIKDLGFLQIGTGHMRHEGNYVYFRPVTHLFNLIPYLIFGINAFGFHIFNLFLFFLACLSIYILFKHLLNNGQLALLISLLFCTHPVNGILVNYLTASGYSILIICINLAIISYFYYMENPQKISYWIMSHFLFTIALLSHETAVMFPFYLSSALYFLKKQDIKSIVFKTSSYYILIFLYLIARARFTGNSSDLTAAMAHFHMSLPQFTASFANVCFFYLKNLILLKDIVLIWASPIINDHLGLRTLLPLISLFILVLFAYKYWGRNEKSFALSWFILNLLPITLASFSRPNLGFIIEPHWLFYSTLGFLSLLAIIIADISKKFIRTLSNFIAITLLISYLLTSHYYNSLWNEEKKYCRYMLSLSPKMELPLFWLADAYLHEQNFKKAKYYFEKAKTGTFGDWYIYLNIGIIEDELGNTDKAAEDYFQALRINPQAAEAYSNLAIILINKGRFSQAEAFLKRAIGLDYYLIDAKKNLIYVYSLTGRKKEALILLRAIEKIDPRDPYIQEKLPLLQGSQ